MAVRLPTMVVEAMGLKEGDDVEIAATGARSMRVEKAGDVEAFFERIRKYRGRLPADFRFDRDEANSRD